MVLVNNISILNVTITLPSTGNWVANLVLDTNDPTGFASGDAVSIVDDAGLTFSGSVVPLRTGLFIDTLHVRVAGGKNGVGKATTPRAFQRAFVRDILNSLLADSGETLSSTVDQSLLSEQIGNWNIYSSSVAASLDLLLANIDPNLNWRILPNGELWIGIETFPADTSQFVIMAPCNPIEQMYTLGISNITFPQGVNLANIGNVSRIEYQILPSTLRAVVWTDINGGRGFLPDLQAIIEYVTDKTKYFGLYLGNVTAQSADWKTVDITSVNSAIPSMSTVPLLSGQYENITGMQVLFGWQGGNASAPFAISFINNTGAVALALAQKTNNNFTNFKSSYDAHTHLYTPGTAPVQVASVAPNNPFPTPTDVSTTKVKGQ